MSEAASGLIVTIMMLVCFGSLVAVMVLIFYVQRRARQARIRYCQGWAAHHGFQYWPEDLSVLGMSSQAPFSVGHSRTAMDVFRGKYRGLHLHFFHYRYRTGSGKNQRTHDWQVVAVSLPAARPLLDIDHENFLSKRLGKDIDFENQAFNDRYRVISASPRFAYDVIHPRTMEWMLSDYRALANRWRFEGPWLMTMRSGALDLDHVMHFADFLVDVRSQVPDHVWTY